MAEETFERVLTEKSPEGYRVRHVRQFDHYDDTEYGAIPVYSEFVQADCVRGDHHFRVKVDGKEVLDAETAAIVARDGLTRYIASVLPDKEGDAK